MCSDSLVLYYRIEPEALDDFQSIEFWVPMQNLNLPNPAEGYCVARSFIGKTLITVFEYLELKPHGACVIKYLDGALMAEYSMRRGVLHGSMIQFHHNGMVREVSNWNNGQQHRHYMILHESGSPLLLCHWNNGKLHGPEFGWNRDFTLSHRVVWSNGVPIDYTLAK